MNQRSLVGLKYNKIWNFIGATLQKSLLIEIIDLLPSLIGFHVENEYIWAVVEMKVIESIESLNANDLSIVGIVFYLLDKGTDELWDLYCESLSECINKASASIVEDAKIVFKDQGDILEIFETYKPDEAVKDEDEEDDENAEEYFINYEEIKRLMVRDNVDKEPISMLNELLLKDL